MCIHFSLLSIVDVVDQLSEAPGQKQGEDGDPALPAHPRGSQIGGTRDYVKSRYFPSIPMSLVCLGFIGKFSALGRASPLPPSEGPRD